MTTEAIPATVLVVDACADTEAVLADPSVDDARLRLERVDDPAAAVARVESGDVVDVVLLGPRLEDPVRVAQRLHSLDREGSVAILAAPEREPEIGHALEVAPFLGGDVFCVSTAHVGIGPLLVAAAERSRARRLEKAEQRRRRETPPPLSARYLGTLLDSAPIGIVTLDGDGAVSGWNRRAGDMLGVPEVEALGRWFPELWPDSEQERLGVLIESFETGGLGSPGEVFELEGKAFEVTGARFTIRSGGSGSILVLQDVTGRVAAERRLLLQKALLEAQAESSEAGITVVSPDGRLEMANRRFAEIWGLDFDVVDSEPGRMRELMLAQAEDPDAMMAPAEVLAAEPEKEHRDELRLRDGRTIERYSTLARGPAGEVVGRVWFFTDITERKRDEEALRFLTEATDLLYASLEYETTLGRLADLAVARVSDWCGVEVVAEGGRRSIAVAHKDPAKVALARELQERYPTEDDGEGVGQVLRTGEPLVFREIPDEMLVQAARDDEHLGLLRALGLRSLMIVPMRSRGGVLGVINFASAESGHVFDDHDLELAQELARRAAIAIDNARVHAELRATARTLQESLLPPHLPGIAGIELAARFRPAGTGLDVGGDFYDIFEARPGEWAVVIGDVCGKGAQAASLTALTRYTVRAAAMYEDGPAGVLRVLNEALLRQRQDYRFTTLVFGLLAPRDGGFLLRVASAGHPAPLVLRAGGSAEAIVATGSLLGVLPDAKFHEVEVELERGDALVLYTDGLTDAGAPARVIDERDLLAELERSAGLSAVEILARLEDLALGSGAERARDDIAIVAARLSIA